MGNVSIILLILNGFLILVTSGFATGSLPGIKKYHEWAEYDSVITAVPRVLLTDTLLSKNDSAVLYKYLGVAQFARPDSFMAASSFLKSLQLDSAQNLDTLYVSASAYRYFYKIKDQWFETLSEAGQLGDYSAQSEGTLKTDSVFASFKSHRQARIYFSAACLGVSGILGALSYREFENGEDNFREMELLARSSQPAKARELEKQVQVNDLHTILYGTASLSALALGGWLLWRTLAEDRRAAIGETGLILAGMRGRSDLFVTYFYCF